MPAEIEPPELARLVDVAECARIDDWSLRSALVRYAQPQPERSSAVYAVIRRIDAVLHSQTKLLRAEGELLWAALEGGDAPTTGPTAFVLEVLRVARGLDRLGDVLATWATDVAAPRPDADVDDTTAALQARLDALGVPDERDREPPPGVRGRRRG